MKSNKYTVMFIPEGESSARSRHISKRVFFLIIAIAISILLIEVTLFFLVPLPLYFLGLVGPCGAVAFV